MMLMMRMKLMTTTKNGTRLSAIEDNQKLVKVNKVKLAPKVDSRKVVVLSWTAEECNNKRFPKRSRPSA